MKRLGIAACILCSALFLLSQEWYESKILVVESWAYLREDFDSWNALQSDIEIDFSEELVPRIQNLALEMLSALIYGYEFTYRPAYSTRDIQEQWEIELVARIDLEDPKLHVIDTRINEEIMYIFYRYNLEEEQVRRLQSWEESSGSLFAKADGLALNSELTDTRLDALVDAIQGSIREKLKGTFANTSRVKGRVKLLTQPFFSDEGSHYASQVSVVLRIDEMETFKVF